MASVRRTFNPRYRRVDLDVAGAHLYASRPVEARAWPILVFVLTGGRQRHMQVTPGDMGIRHLLTGGCLAILVIGHALVSASDTTLS